MDTTQQSSNELIDNGRRIVARVSRPLLVAFSLLLGIHDFGQNVRCRLCNFGINSLTHLSARVSDLNRSIRVNVDECRLITSTNSIFNCCAGNPTIPPPCVLLIESSNVFSPLLVVGCQHQLRPQTRNRPLRGWNDCSIDVDQLVGGKHVNGTNFVLIFAAYGSSVAEDGLWSACVCVDTCRQRENITKRQDKKKEDKTRKKRRRVRTLLSSSSLRQRPSATKTPQK